MMGSGVGAAEEAVEHAGQAWREGRVCSKSGLFRPFAVEAFLAGAARDGPAASRCWTAPRSRARLASRCTRTWSPRWWKRWQRSTMPQGDWRPLRPVAPRNSRRRWCWRSSTNWRRPSRKRHFTVGIVDDVTHLSLKYDAADRREADDVIRAVFYGLGSDGTVGASKNSVKIVGENTPMYAQGYFVYDSKKAGSVTVSHLRFSPRPINSTYLIDRANFVACHQFDFTEKMDVLEIAEPGATFLLNSPYGADEVWDKLPVEMQQQIIDKKLKFYVVDGVQVATDAGMGGRINTVMQTCFFALAGILPRDEAIEQIKKAIEKTYGKRGESILQQELRRRRRCLGQAARSQGAGQRPAAPSSGCRWWPMAAPISSSASPPCCWPARATCCRSAPCRPTARSPPTRRRSRSAASPWRSRSGIPTICIDCALCALVCPHAAIRMKPYLPNALQRRSGRRSSRRKPRARTIAGHRMTIQVAPGRLHRLRRLRRRLPGQEQGSGQAPGDQHGAEAGPPGA